MKKLLVAILTLALFLSLAACGGSGDSDAPSGENAAASPETTGDDSEPATESEPESTMPSESESIHAGTPDDEGSLSDFLAAYGLTEDDITPEHFIEFDELDMDGDKNAGEIGSTGFIKITVDKDATGEEEVKAWFEKVYGKMQQLSSDGKLYTNFMSMDKESTLEALYENPLWKDFPGTMWAYPYKMPKGDMKINVSTSYDYETGIYKMSVMLFGG
jgi:predicted small lipoprotein YifL